MTIAILVGTVIAALAALAAVVLPEWHRRPRLHIEFRDGFSSSETEIIFYFRFENYGDASINQIDLYLVAPGELLGTTPTLGRFRLDPGERNEINVHVARPGRAELHPGQIEPTLNVPIGVLARYGRRHKIVYHPSSPLNDQERAAALKSLERVKL